MSYQAAIANTRMAQTFENLVFNSTDKKRILEAVWCQPKCHCQWLHVINLATLLVSGVRREHIASVWKVPKYAMHYYNWLVLLSSHSLETEHSGLISTKERNVLVYYSEAGGCHRFSLAHLTLHSYDYNTHVEGLLPAKLCLVTLFTSEQCLPFERFLTWLDLQHIQIVNKTSSFEATLTGNDAMQRQAELTAIPFDV